MIANKSLVCNLLELIFTSPLTKSIQCFSTNSVPVLKERLRNLLWETLNVKLQAYTHISYTEFAIK
jgi:hypothetical protein